MISETTHLYVIGAKGGPLKIGLAINVAKRLKGIQTGHAHPLSVAAAWPVPAEYARAIEGKAHWILRSHRTHGEWFKVSLEQAKEAAAVSIETNGHIERPEPRPVGRRKINDEQTPARFPEGTLARIDGLLADKEKRSDFIREAVEREIKRRSRIPKPD